MPSLQELFYFRKRHLQGTTCLHFWGSPEGKHQLLETTPPLSRWLRRGGRLRQGCGQGGASGRGRRSCPIDTIINGPEWGLPWPAPHLPAQSPQSAPAPTAHCSSQRRVPQADPRLELLPGEHGGGRGHQVQHPELPEAHQEEGIDAAASAFLCALKESLSIDQNLTVLKNTPF